MTRTRVYRQPIFETTDIPNLLKDRRTNVIINTNYGEYHRIKAARDKARQNKTELYEMRNEMREFRDGMNEILKLLRKQNG